MFDIAEFKNRLSDGVKTVKAKQNEKDGKYKAITDDMQALILSLKLIEDTLPSRVKAIIKKYRGEDQT